MKIFSVFGLGLLIITLQFLVPEIFSGFQNTLLVFFETVSSMLTLSQSTMTAGFVPVVPQ